jgi:hypothetical protein
MTEEEADLSAGVLTEAEALAEAESGMAQMRKVYDGTEGAQAPDANA